MPLLLSAGSNAQGQLGNGSTDDSHSFQRCSFLDCEPGTLPPGTIHVVSISGGANHTLALLDIHDASSGQLRRELWGCGSGQKGQLGPAFHPLTLPASSSPLFRPVVLPFEQYGLAGYSYKKVCASWETTYVTLESPGKGDLVISMGANDFGDLGIGSYGAKEKEEPFHVISFDHVLDDGLSLRTDTILVRHVATGQHHVVVYLQATLADGTVRSFLVGWGTSRHGQLGEFISSGAKQDQGQPFVSKPRLIDMPDDVVGLALGMQHTIVLHASMQVSGIGSNRKGQLSEIRLWDHVRRVACTWNGTYAVIAKDTGEWHIMSTGSNSHGQLGRTLSNDVSSGPVAFQDVLNSFSPKRIACGSEHVLCLLSAPPTFSKHGNTEVWGWGWNEHGNLGLGTTGDMSVPVKLWPMETNDMQNVDGVWAGCGTSWLYIRTD